MTPFTLISPTHPSMADTQFPGTRGLCTDRIREMYGKRSSMGEVHIRKALGTQLSRSGNLSSGCPMLPWFLITEQDMLNPGCKALAGTASSVVSSMVCWHHRAV